MQLVVVDTSPQLRAALLGRVQEGCRQAGLQRITVVDVDPLNLDSVNWEASVGCFIGAGCASMIKEVLGKLHGAAMECPFAIVLDVETYASEAIAIHKILGRTVICETDLTQIGSFVVDCERQASGRPMGVRARHIVGVAQLKGGVGATTMTAALGVYWARAGRTVALVDLDDVCPHLTEWSRVAPSQRLLMGELLRTGEISMDRLRDFVQPVEGFDGRMVAIGQPLAYAEGFHLKSYILDGAPSSSEFVGSLVSLLSSEYDIVLIDLGRSWGVATFAALPWCERVLFMLEDDGIAVRRSLDTLVRLKQESGDPEEFNLSRWAIGFNKVTGRRLTERDVRSAVAEIELFPKNVDVYPIGYSEKGRQWGMAGQSFFDLAEGKIKRQIGALADSLVGAGGKSIQVEKRHGWLPWGR